jgi:hypothetical protein
MGDGMTEAQLKALTQQTVWVCFWFAVIVIPAFYLSQPVGEDGPRRWRLLWDRVKPFLPTPARYVEAPAGAGAESAARTGAAGGEGGAPHTHAGAAGAAGACAGAEAVIPSGSLLLSAEEQGAIAAMVRHKIAVPPAKKLDTIQAGWPEIKARSGDPQSKYARASAIYDSVFAPPPPAVTPLAGREVPAGVEFAGQRQA